MKSVAAGLPDYTEVRRKPRRSHQGEADSKEGDGVKMATAGRKRRKKKSERTSLHEELLEFISQEWASLDMADVRFVTILVISTCNSCKTLIWIHEIYGRMHPN